MLRGRARDIFLDFCLQVDRLPFGSALPSVRELRSRYSAGQVTIQKVLKCLEKYRDLERGPRRKTHIADPAAKKHHSIYGAGALFPGKNMTRETTLVMVDFLRDKWEHVIVEYNRTHTHKIVIRYASSHDEFITLGTNRDVDFVLFHTNPVRNDLAMDLFDFIDMKTLCNGLDSKAFYETTFQRDPADRIWGVSAKTSIPVLVFAEKYCLDSALSLRLEDLVPEMKRLAREFPELEYPGLFDGYIVYLLACGLRMLKPGTMKLNFDYAAFREPLICLKKMVDQKLIPLFSDAFYNEYGRKLFVNGKIAMGHFWMPALERYQLIPCRYIPMPIAETASAYAWTECFSICMHSMNYNQAWEFIQYILTPEIQRKIASGTDFLPVRRGVVPSKMTEKQFEPFRQYLDRAVEFPEDYIFTGRLRMMMEAGLDRWIKFGGDLKEALDNMEKSCLQHIKYNQKKGWQV